MKAVNKTPKTLHELLRSSWQDWSGFARYLLLGGIAAGAWFASESLAGWVASAMFPEPNPSPLVLLAMKVAYGTLFASLALLADVLLGCVRTSEGSIAAAWFCLFTFGYFGIGWQAQGMAPFGLTYLLDAAIAAAGFYVAWKKPPWKLFWPLEEPEEDREITRAAHLEKRP